MRGAAPAGPGPQGSFYSAPRTHRHISEGYHFPIFGLVLVVSQADFFFLHIGKSRVQCDVTASVTQNSLLGVKKSREQPGEAQYKTKKNE